MLSFARFRRLARVWDYLLGNAPAKPHKRRNRLRFEVLEGRDVPAVVYATDFEGAVDLAGWSATKLSQTPGTAAHAAD